MFESVFEIHLDFGLLHRVTTGCRTTMAQVATIKGAQEVISDSLHIPMAEALQLLVSQPALIYDFSRETIQSRLAGLAAIFGVPAGEVS